MCLANKPTSALTARRKGLGSARDLLQAADAAANGDARTVLRLLALVQRTPRRVAQSLLRGSHGVGDERDVVRSRVPGARRFDNVHRGGPRRGRDPGRDVRREARGREVLGCGERKRERGDEGEREESRRRRTKARDEQKGRERTWIKRGRYRPVQEPPPTTPSAEAKRRDGTETGDDDAARWHCRVCVRGKKVVMGKGEEERR